MVAEPTLAIRVDTPSAAAGLGYMVIGTGAIGTATIAPDSIYVDQATSARSMSIRRGVSNVTDLLFRADVGTLDVEFDNRTRAFDPASNPDIIPGRAINVQATYNGTTYDLFTGTVDQWKPSYPAEAHDAVTTAAANDGIAQLAQLDVTETAPSETTGARITRLANLIGWPSALRSIDTGTTTMEAGTQTSSALAAMQGCADSELGQLYVDTDGTLTFRDRNAQVSEARSITSQATFGDSGVELRYTDIEPVPTDKTSVINQVTLIFNQAGDSVTATDGESVTTYGVRAASLTVSINDSSTAASLASFLVSIYSTAIPRFASLTIKPSTRSTLWPQVFGRQLGDRITVKLTSPGGGSRLSEDCFIVGIAHDVTASTGGVDWTTTFLLMDAGQWPIPLLIGTGLIDGSDGSTIWF